MKNRNGKTEESEKSFQKRKSKQDTDNLNFMDRPHSGTFQRWKRKLWQICQTFKCKRLCQTDLKVFVAVPVTYKFSDQYLHF